MDGVGVLVDESDGRGVCVQVGLRGDDGDSDGDCDTPAGTTDASVIWNPIPMTDESLVNHRVRLLPLTAMALVG